MTSCVEIQVPEYECGAVGIGAGAREKMGARSCDVHMSSLHAVSEVGEWREKDGGRVRVNEAGSWCRECGRIEMMYEWHIHSYITKGFEAGCGGGRYVVERGGM
jgi:hypothetical protein